MAPEGIYIRHLHRFLKHCVKIYVEYNSPDDKVDIALEYNGSAVKSIQVKSSINSFDCKNIIKWTNDLKDSWEYDKELYKKRNQVERYFLRIKRFRKVFTRYDKLDSIFLSVIMLAMIFDALFM